MNITPEPPDKPNFAQIARDIGDCCNDQVSNEAMILAALEKAYDAGGRSFFVCGTDYRHELGNTFVQTFASADDCAKHKGCTYECGIVEIRPKFVRWAKLPR